MTTPLRRQYLDIKRRYPQAILFFRLGDFYETFDQDAETVARELDIVLTSRPVPAHRPAPLAVTLPTAFSYSLSPGGRNQAPAICLSVTQDRSVRLVDKRAK